jgi:hypothetical protein
MRSLSSWLRHACFACAGLEAFSFWRLSDLHDLTGKEPSLAGSGGESCKLFHTAFLPVGTSFLPVGTSFRFAHQLTFLAACTRLFVSCSFDPLGLGPKGDAAAWKEMQTKELNNGRLAMIAIAAFTAEELVSKQEIFEHLALRFEKEAILELDDIERDIGIKNVSVQELCFCCYSMGQFVLTCPAQCGTELMRRCCELTEWFVLTQRHPVMQ